MKRKVLLISILFVLIFTASASITHGNGYTVNTQGLSILAGFGEKASIKVIPIAAQSQFYLAGMPFNIEESYVAYNTESSGRLIATWDVIANTLFEISIECPDLTYQGAGEPVNLPYQLSFEYDLSYSIDGLNNVEKPLSGTMLVHSGAGEQVFRVSDMVDNVAAGFFIGSVAGNVFFEFDEYMHDGTTKVSDYIKNTAPSGDYVAIVKLQIQAEG